MNINEVTISGILSREPMRAESSGYALMYFDLAHHKSAVEVELFKCLAMGDLAMNLQNLSKGDYVVIKGRMNSYIAENEVPNNRPYYEIECAQVARCEYVASDRKNNPLKQRVVSL